MAAPTYLFTPAGATYDVINASPGDTTIEVVFKYPISDRDTIPAWFYVDGNTHNFGDGASWEWTDSGRQTIDIKTDMVSAGWSAWKDEDGNTDIFNRSAILGFMQVAMKDSITITSDYRIQEYYTYNTYRIDASSDLTITLPEAQPAVQRHVNLKVDNATGVITLSAAWGTIDGSATKTLSRSDTIQTFYNDGANWYSSKPVGFSDDDDTPVTTMRCVTQSQYDALSVNGGPDDNTLYLIKDE